MLGRYLLVLLIGYLLYKLVKPYLKKFLFPPEIENDNQKKTLHVDKSDVMDADFKDIKDDSPEDN